MWVFVKVQEGDNQDNQLTAGQDQPLYEDKYYFITLHLPLHLHLDLQSYYTQHQHPQVPTPTKVGKVHVGGDMTR